MFRREGSGRDARLNAWIAGYLASIAGFVNSSGFLLLGTFTSHVTGNVGRLSHDLSRGDWKASFGAASLVLSFFAGAFGASLVIEGSAGRVPHAYGYALLLQSVLLATSIGSFQHGSMLDARAAVLCAAMGMQNSLITRLSGAVVRTTHLTGIMTDLGIEAARWYRWHRERIGLPVLFRGRSRPTKPAKQSALLLITIASAFFLGSLTGGLLTLQVPEWAMALPTGATLALALYAFSQREPPPDAPR